MTAVLITAVSAVVATALVTWLITRSVFLTRLRSQEQMYAKETENAERLAQQAQNNYDKALKEMKETIISNMTADNTPEGKCLCI